MREDSSSQATREDSYPQTTETNSCLRATRENSYTQPPGELRPEHEKRHTVQKKTTDIRKYAKGNVNR